VSVVIQLIYVTCVIVWCCVTVASVSMFIIYCWCSVCFRRCWVKISSMIVTMLPASAALSCHCLLTVVQLSIPVHNMSSTQKLVQNICHIDWVVSRQFLLCVISCLQHVALVLMLFYCFYQTFAFVVVCGCLEVLWHDLLFIWSSGAKSITSSKFIY